MRLMGITSYDVTDPTAAGKAPAPLPRSSGGGGAAGGSPMDAKRRAFLAQMGLDPSGMPLGAQPPKSSTSGCPTTTATDSTSPLPPPPPRGSRTPIPTNTTNINAKTSSSGGDAVEALKAAGNGAFERGDFPEAVRRYTEAIDTARASRAGNDVVVMGVLFSNRSASYLQGAKQLDISTTGGGPEGAYDRALCDAEEAIRLRPDWFKAHSRLGDAYFKAQHYSQAAEAYELASRLQPGNESLVKSLAESIERARSGSREEWQARRQARKHQYQQQRSGGGGGATPANASLASSYLSAEQSPSSPGSVGYEDGPGASYVSSLNATTKGGRGSTSASTRSLGSGGSRQMWTELQAEVAASSSEGVTGDDYRRQQLEKFRSDREGKERRLFGSSSKVPAPAVASTPTHICGRGGRGRGGGGNDPTGPYASGDDDALTPKWSASSPALNGGGGGERVGSQFIPDEYSSNAASAYQQRLLEQFRQRKMKT